MVCCACDTWKLQVSQVSAAALLISCCRKSIILIFNFSPLLPVTLYRSCPGMVWLDDIIFVLLRRNVFAILVFSLRLSVSWELCYPRIQLMWNDVIFQRRWIMMPCCGCRESIFRKSWLGVLALDCTCLSVVVVGNRVGVPEFWHDVISWTLGSCSRNF